MAPKIFTCSHRSRQGAEQIIKIKANNESLERLYPHEPLQLIIFYEENIKTMLIL